MNREEVPGRASLSFPANQGILDMEQILQTDPWSQIDDFVQCNFIQDVLNEFNERMALDPKHAPADNKSSTDKRPTPSSRGTRKSQTGRTNEGKKKADKVGGPKSTERKADIAQKSESGRTKASNGNEETERVNTSRENGKKPGTVRKSATNRRTVGNSVKMRCKKQSAPAPVNQNEEEAASVSQRTVENTVDANSGNENSVNTRTPRCRNSKLPFKASTPMGELSKISNSLGKECAIEKNKVAAAGKKFSATSDASIKKSDKSRKCATRDLNNNCNKLGPAEKLGKNAAVICKNEAATTRKITEKKRAPTSRQSETSKCNILRDRKPARAAEGKKVGKFEQRLLDKRERRDDRTRSRHERKAERAMEKFSHHVTRIVRKMGYLPEYSSSSSSCSEDGDRCSDSTDESSRSDSTDGSSYSDSTDESSCSDSCCSNSSCSCCTTCSNSSEYTEYSPYSSSN